MKRITKYLTLFLISILLFLTSCISNSTPGEVVYTITYHTNATPTTITKEYNKDSLLTESEVSSLSISKEGFTKEYWYLDSNYKEKVIFP